MLKKMTQHEGRKVLLFGYLMMQERQLSQGNLIRGIENKIVRRWGFEKNVLFSLTHGFTLLLEKSLLDIVCCSDKRRGFVCSNNSGKFCFSTSLFKSSLGICKSLYLLIRKQNGWKWQFFYIYIFQKKISEL